MKRISILFLQIIVVLICTSTLVFLLWEPHIEGRNLNATLFDIYFKDPFLLYAYIASISFFVGLYQVFKLLGYLGRNNTFSPNSVTALHIIKYCAIILIIFILGAEVYFFTVQTNKGEDIAGGVAMGLFMIFISTITITMANLIEKKVQNGMNVKSESNLTP
jgi:hypothetical protein